MTYSETIVAMMTFLHKTSNKVIEKAGKCWSNHWHFWIFNLHKGKYSGSCGSWLLHTERFQRKSDEKMWTCSNQSVTTLGVIGRNGTPYILARPKSAVHTRTHTHKQTWNIVVGNSIVRYCTDCSKKQVDWLAI